MCTDLPPQDGYRGIFYCQNEEDREIVAEVLERYGIPYQVLSGMAVLRRGRMLVLTTMDGARIQTPGLKERGIPFLKDLEKGGRLSSAAIRLFGKLATRNVVELQEEEFSIYLRGQVVEKRKGRGEYVIVKYRGWAVGGGILSKRGLIPMIPKAAKSVKYY